PAPIPGSTPGSGPSLGMPSSEPEAAGCSAAGPGSFAAAGLLTLSLLLLLQRRAPLGARVSRRSRS
ncbi:MAG TPA: hypothetical protein VNA24_02775, partial [Hyalangium sp.]|nr:hypothetical protein [Hyalangium sp.]